MDSEMPKALTVGVWEFKVLPHVMNEATSPNNG